MDGCCHGCTNETWEVYFVDHKVQGVLLLLVFVVLALAYQLFRCRHPRQRLMCVIMGEEY